MTHPIRVGIQITQQHATYAQIREAWKRVDASGADTLFNWDHFCRGKWRCMGDVG